MTILRFITCGNVDDGKSTLMGRLLWDTDNIFEDQRTRLISDSRRWGTCDGDLDYSLLFDGLDAERNQNITIDVSYRYFRMADKSFIMIDTPGHEQYTANMVTGASNAQAALLVVDVQKGITIQTRRHLSILKMLRVENIAVVVNKMDKVSYDKNAFQKIKTKILELNPDCLPIPVSAKCGENVVNPSAQMNWYTGPTVVDFLKTVPVKEVNSEFNIPIQAVIRPDDSFRAVTGTIYGGDISVHDKVKILPSGITTVVKELYSLGRKRKRVGSGSPVTIVLRDQVGITRGNVIVKDEGEIVPHGALSCTLFWMDGNPTVINKTILIKIGSSTQIARISNIKRRLDFTTLQYINAEELHQNDIGMGEISLDSAMVIESFDRCPNLGRFILMDRDTNKTIGAGIIGRPLDSTVFTNKGSVERHDGNITFPLKPTVVWLTGMSGSGKSTIANELERQFRAEGVPTYVIDGDNIRQGLCSDLGFSPEDRRENIRRISEVARMMVDAGLLVIVAAISPIREDREKAKRLFPEEDFIEVFVHAPLSVLIERDTKGLYGKVTKGELENALGVGSGYQPPENPHISIDTSCVSINDATDTIKGYLDKR